MRALVPALLLGSLVFVAMIYANATNPDFLDEFKRMVGLEDSITRTPAQSNKPSEAQRLQRIDALLIAPANKSDLRKGLAFWGAAPHMIELAFNERSDSVFVNVRNKVTFEFYVYNHTDQRGQTFYEFQDGKLVCAHSMNTRRSSCNASQTSYYGANFPFTTIEQNR